MRLAALALAALPAAAHVMSVSSGDLVLRGTRGQYELRMPLYEIAHMRDPGEELLSHIRFTGGGGVARLLRKACREEPGAGAYVCSADYEFPGTVDRLDVECRFHAVTVPNHVHLLRTERDGKRDQGVFDRAFPHAVLRFEPPGAGEVALEQATAGAARAFTPVQLLFLAALVMAARRRRELLALGGAFLVGQIAVAAAVPHTSWDPAARFVEAAAALTVAYLAVEILLLPKAGARWAIAGALGGFHGLYFALFLRTSGYAAGWVLAGAAAAEVLLMALLALVLSRLARAAAALHPLRVGASLLLAAGMAWFFFRMAG